VNQIHDDRGMAKSLLWVDVFDIVVWAMCTVTVHEALVSEVTVDVVELACNCILDSDYE